ncbi:MAG: FMN-binding protein [Oscillospiraceae bacterium]|nr:FMN-binding protein [Oscillospiraceae bacterium]
MKKLCTILAVLGVLLSFAACSKAEPVVETKTGEADGYGGKITAVVTTTDGVITDLELTGEKETPAIGGAALEPLKEAIVKAGKVEGVEAVAGATWTSNGVFNAVNAALGVTADDGKGDTTEASASGLYAGLGVVTTPRLGPGKDDKDVPVYSFNEVAAYVVLDENKKIVDLEVDILEIITPNHDDAEDNYLAGWPGATYSADMDGDGTAEGVLEETEDVFTESLTQWKTKRQKGSAYKMNSGTWEGEMDIYENFFKGKTADEVVEFFTNCCSDLNGRPLNGKSEKDADVEKAGKLTDEQKAQIDAVSGATMSLNDAHGDIVGAIVKACENARPVETDKDIAKVGLGIEVTPRLGPGKDDQEVPVYSFNTVFTGVLLDADGKFVSVTTDILEVITPNHDGADDNVFAGWPGQSYNNDENADGVVDGVLEQTEDTFVETLKGYRTKRDLGTAYKMKSGTWTEEMNIYEASFVGKTADEVKAWVDACFSDLNGRPLNGNSDKDADVEKAGKLTDDQKASIDAISGATMSLTDAHGNIVNSLVKAYEVAKDSVIKLG